VSGCFYHVLTCVVLIHLAKDRCSAHVSHKVGTIRNHLDAPSGDKAQQSDEACLSGSHPPSG
jgi:hypothetical protein